MEAYPAKGMLRCGYKLRGVAAALQLQVVWWQIFRDVKDIKMHRGQD
jgi:NAD(P)H-dependent FMN reductase